MKVRNKKTGVIKNFALVATNDSANDVTLAQVNDEWEDVSEEPKEYWYLSDVGEIVYMKDDGSKFDKDHKFIGNYFETPEEAELAVRKLEAWKLLKDMGFKIEGIRYRNHKSYIEWNISQKVRDDHFTSEAFNDALHFFFGGEE